MSNQSSADNPRHHSIIIPADEESSLLRAARALQRGDLVVFPTETVYGLGADAGNEQAIQAIFRLKSRPASNPLIIHCFDTAQAQRIAHFDERANHLARQFWPGPLTMILPVRDHAMVCSSARAGLNTVALRIPNHPTAHQLLRLSSLPIAAPSANPSGKISPTRASDVTLPEDTCLECILDAGPCPNGIESTIIDLSGSTPTILRPGPLTHEQIEAILPLAQYHGKHGRITPKSPGQSLRHYAPSLPMRLNVRQFEADDAALLFDCPTPKQCVAHAHLSRKGDLEQAAANLYTMMRRLDHSPARRIAVSSIPQHGVGLAINDRLQRAAFGSKEES